MAEDGGSWRYFVTYSGVKLPLKLVSPLDASELNFRDTFLRARFDAEDRIVELEKLVHSEVQLHHRYEYSAAGTLARAEITVGDETMVREFGESGPAAG
jgi:hypothetical protein